MNDIAKDFHPHTMQQVDDVESKMTQETKYRYYITFMMQGGGVSHAFATYGETMKEEDINDLHKGLTKKTGKEVVITFIQRLERLEK